MIRDDLTPLDPHTTDYEPLYPPVFEPQPTRGPVLGAVLRYWYLVLLPIILFGAAAYAISERRDPTYTAEARLNVGGFNITTQSLPGFAGGAYLLSNAYSRAAYGDEVLVPVGEKVGMTPAQLADAISASPVADSPIIRIEAESGNERQAIAIANLTAQQLQDHARTLAASNPDSQRLLREFKSASRDYTAAVRRARRAERRGRGESAAQTAVELARLRRDSKAQLYSASIGGQATTNAVQLLAPARSAESDAGPFRQRVIAGALLGGLAVGIALAYLVGRRRMSGRFIT